MDLLLHINPNKTLKNVHTKAIVNTVMIQYRTTQIWIHVNTGQLSVQYSDAT